MSNRALHIVIGITLVLAAGNVFGSVWLYTRLQEDSVQGCHRQNQLRLELNHVLRRFHQPSLFATINCDKAYSLTSPPPPQPIRHTPHP